MRRKLRRSWRRGEARSATSPKPNSIVRSRRFGWIHEDHHSQAHFGWRGHDIGAGPMSRLDPRGYSLRWKLALAVAAAVLCFSGSTFWLISRAAERESIGQFQDQAKDLAANTAFL